MNTYRHSVFVKGVENKAQGQHPTLHFNRTNDESQQKRANDKDERGRERESRYICTFNHLVRIFQTVRKKDMQTVCRAPIRHLFFQPDSFFTCHNLPFFICFRNVPTAITNATHNSGFFFSFSSF